MQKRSKTYSIEPAERVNSVSEYYFSRKLREVADLNAKGRRIINLGIGSPDLPPSDLTVEALCFHAGQPGEHGYQPYTGIAELRRAYSAWYQTWYNVETDPDGEILPLIGSKEGILHISMAFLNPGDAVLVPNPGYPTYTSVSNLVGAKIIAYELDEASGWYPDLASLEREDLGNVKLMWVNYPHMPTGAKADRDLFARLVDFGRRHGIVIVNDNPYSFILNDNPLSIMSIPGAKEVCIELNSLSKSHNMPGWRMGMLTSNSRFVQWILKVKSNVDSGQFKPMQYAAIEALKAPREWYLSVNGIYKSRRAVALEIMKTISCACNPNQSGMFLWGKLAEGWPGSEIVADRILYGAGVFVTPGFIFGSCGERFIRISLCCPEETLCEALGLIEDHRGDIY
ncbi:MAG: aminotransferase class I/II-fold pyridoxal phosphate-dependent enzyme [Tannerellaceae bacterium]|jgi:aspartate/methionine/tyrosine aminotransferase|nr:aminotransferase class I/II-fold pyridoxal phosphate-dependent enzyme [Tannerellaceae bacterium]